MFQISSSTLVMHVALRNIVSVFLSRSFLQMIAIHFSIANPDDPLSSSPGMPLFSGDQIVSEQYSINNEDLILINSADSTDLIDPINENPSCSTDNAGARWIPSPSNDLWGRDMLAPEEDSSLDSPLLITSVHPQCANPNIDNDLEHSNQEPYQNPGPIIPELIPEFYPEKERGRCSGWSRWVPACCTTRDGDQVSDCFICTYCAIHQPHFCHILRQAGFSESSFINLPHLPFTYFSPTFLAVFQKGGKEENH